MFEAYAGSQRARRVRRIFERETNEETSHRKQKSWGCRAALQSSSPPLLHYLVKKLGRRAAPQSASPSPPLPSTNHVAYRNGCSPDVLLMVVFRSTQQLTSISPKLQENIPRVSSPLESVNPNPVTATIDPPLFGPMDGVKEWAKRFGS